MLRVAVDTGGTFTDLVVDDGRGPLRIFKSSTTPDDPVRGVLDVLAVAADGLDTSSQELLAECSLFIHGTTRATNAILTGTTATTALLCTGGHPDTLVFREGGRTEPFNFTRPFPDPYVPRALTFEVPERISAEGAVVTPLDEAALREIVRRLPALGVEAVAVTLLWSIVDPRHELAVARILEEELPGIPYTLSHQLNPIIREYRRSSSTAIDASLKPVMTAYLDTLEARLRDAGFAGRLLMVTSNGGLMPAAYMAEAPIHSINSGPAMAPVAGRHYAELEASTGTAVVADTGGTTYDVSVVRRGAIPASKETWIGGELVGHMTGFPSVDVTSIGAGGGSIARVDEGGLLHVGPQSAGALPGPACYGRGGELPTVSDAALVLGYLDPDFFLGGTVRLDVEQGRAAVEREVARKLGLGLDESAAAVIELATEAMARAIEELTINQGIDPREAVLIGGGGAAGLNSVAIARRLGCRAVVIPPTGAALSAAGALMSDLRAEHAATYFTTSQNDDLKGVNRILAELERRCEQFIAEVRTDGAETFVEYFAEARYPHQVWELEVPLRANRLASDESFELLRQDFHRTHHEVFAISEPEAPIEVVTWRARAHCRLPGQSTVGRLRATTVGGSAPTHRSVYFSGHGRSAVPVHRLDALIPNERLAGPAVIDSPFTTVVVDPDATAVRTAGGSLLLTPAAAPAKPTSTMREVGV
jgi:N-methylhydantoinase A